jgi:hypothetical protein
MRWPPHQIHQQGGAGAAGVAVADALACVVLDAVASSPDPPATRGRRRCPGRDRGRCLGRCRARCCGKLYQFLQQGRAGGVACVLAGLGSIPAVLDEENGGSFFKSGLRGCHDPEFPLDVLVGDAFLL